MTNGMTTEMRKTGIDVVGNMSWGTHFCLFYDTKADLLETLVSYCKAGLESQEFCIWVAAPPVTVEDARLALKGAIPDFDQYASDSSIEIVPARDWYLHDDGSFDLKRVIAGWNQKLMHASAKGYAGVRVTGDTAWLEKQYWKDFCEYEDALNEAVANQRLAALCTYPLAAYGAAEILDVVRTHQFAVTNRRGNWDVIETVGHKQAKAEIKRLNEELEQRVIERTSQLKAVNEELTREVLVRQRAEKDLRKTEAYLAEAQRLSHTGSWASIPATGEIRYFSEECYRVTGFDPRDGHPRYETFLQRVHPDDQAKVREAVETAGRENAEFELDYRIVHPDGEIRDIHVVGHPVISSPGDLVEFVGTVMDVTESKRADLALRRSEAYLAEAQRLSHTGSWAYNIGSKELVHSSEEHCRLFGFDRERGMPSFEELIQRIHPEERASAIQRFESQIRAATDSDGHFRIAHPDGTTKYVYSTVHPVFNASGDLVEFVGTLMDITERKRAEEERERLRHAQADLARVTRVTTMGELTASLAHEIKQPISAALMNAGTCLRWLGREEPDVTEAREAASRIIKDITRASDIISRIGSLFKKGGQQHDLLDANEVVQEMIALLRSEASRYSISIEADLSSDLPKVMADRVQLQQVFMNLMLNGIDAMKESGRGNELTIKSEAADGRLLISVRDTGIGIPPQEADQIFNAFFTTKPQGTGMGLTISRSIVESHGGRLWATANPGRGATFHLTLPTSIGAHA
jgi:PAS domain S-box-containing protein